VGRKISRNFPKVAADEAGMTTTFGSSATSSNLRAEKGANPSEVVGAPTRGAPHPPGRLSFAACLERLALDGRLGRMEVAAFGRAGSPGREAKHNGLGIGARAGIGGAAAEVDGGDALDAAANRGNDLREHSFDDEALRTAQHRSDLASLGSEPGVDPMLQILSSMGPRFAPPSAIAP
jgi:hypothetical protein